MPLPAVAAVKDGFSWVTTTSDLPVIWLAWLVLSGVFVVVAQLAASAAANEKYSLFGTRPLRLPTSGIMEVRMILIHESEPPSIDQP
jgi:hypothetical protein